MEKDLREKVTNMLSEIQLMVPLLREKIHNDSAKCERDADGIKDVHDRMKLMLSNDNVTLDSDSCSSDGDEESPEQLRKVTREAIMMIQL